MQQGSVIEKEHVTPRSDLDVLRAAHRSSGLRFNPEESPFGTVFVDLTHRCNMACKNCYIPVRGLPDLPTKWLSEQLARFPRRIRVRLVGAEPTVREDLPEIIATVRALGHIPVILSNGLKLGRRSYVKTLRAAGLRTVYLSMNGGLCDDLYEAIDDLRCAARKLLALENLLVERMNVTLGMILVPGVNDEHFSEFLPFLLERGVRDIHLRSVGPFGNYMKDKPFDLDGLEARLREALPGCAPPLKLVSAKGSSRDFKAGRTNFQLTQWPDLGSSERGRLTPDGFVEPMFESILANEFSY